MRSRRWLDALTPSAAALILLAAVVLGPLPVILAFRDLPQNPWEGARALGDSELWNRLGRMLLISFMTLGIAVPLGLVQGWLLARSDLPLKRWLLAVTPFPLFLPPLVHVLAWFGAWGLRGMVAIVLVYVVSLMLAHS